MPASPAGFLRFKLRVVTLSSPIAAKSVLNKAGQYHLRKLNRNWINRGANVMRFEARWQQSELHEAENLRFSAVVIRAGAAKEGKQSKINGRDADAAMNAALYGSLVAHVFLRRAKGIMVRGTARAETTKVSPGKA